MAKHIAYIGTYTGHGSKGIYRMAVDCADGSMTLLDTVPGENPSYLTLSHNGSILYATSETMHYRGLNGGAVAAYAVDGKGKLTYLNEQPTFGTLPCHLSTDPKDNRLFCANYGEGTATIYNLDADGKILDNPLILVHEGTGPDKSRQEKPHVHFTKLTPDNKFLAVADLGLDSVCLYPFDEKTGLAPQATVVEETPACGPRHLDFTPDGKFAYLVCEMGNRVIAHTYDGEKLTPFQEISTLPEDYKGNSTCAAIHISPDGRFLCASNRGHDSLAVYAIGGDGQLTRIQIIPSGGKIPRDFVYLPGGGFILVANQESSRLSLFAVDGQTGLLTDTGRGMDIPNPVNILFGTEIK